MTGSLKAALLQALTIGLQEQEDCWFGLLSTRFDAEFAASDIISECEPRNGKFRTRLAPLGAAQIGSENGIESETRGPTSS
jgi:hypothetical protein